MGVQNVPTFADLDRHPDVDDMLMTDAGVLVGRIGNPNGIGVVWPYSRRSVTVLTATEARSLAYNLLRAIDPKSSERMAAVPRSRKAAHRKKRPGNRDKKPLPLGIHGVA
jgi:hypothetical protein